MRWMPTDARPIAQARPCEDCQGVAPHRVTESAPYTEDPMLLEQPLGHEPVAGPGWFHGGYPEVPLWSETSSPLGCWLEGPDRFWIRGEYLMWWTEGSSYPPLVTTSELGTSVADSGILGLDSTSILFGGGDVNTDMHSGGRLTLGWWLMPCELAVEANYLGIGRETTELSGNAAEHWILARPYFDLATNTDAAMLIAHPELLDGSITAEASTELQGAEVLVRRIFLNNGCQQAGFLVGYRFARLDERLEIGHQSEWDEAQGQIAAGTTREVFDLFDTQSRFHGAEAGFLYLEQRGRWSLELLAKLALGSSRSEVTIDGETVTTTPGGGSTASVGGLLAQQTNVGHYGQDDFAIIPELGVTLSYMLTPRLHASFGYTFLYWSKVARPGDQIDLDVSQLPPDGPTGARRPEFTFLTTDFWAQGLNFGLEYRF